MPPHNLPLRNDAVELLLKEAFRLAVCTPEPEVAKATLVSLKCKSLASLIAGLIAEHEPMLKAEVNGTTVTVREVGGEHVMRFTVESAR